MLEIFRKICVSKIIARHLNTLRNSNTEDNSTHWPDIILFYVLPLCLALSSPLVVERPHLPDNVLGAAISAVSIFSGLLLNLLVLMFDQRSKINSDKMNHESYRIRDNLLYETTCNIAYGVLISVIFVIFSVIYIFTNDISLANITLINKTVLVTEVFLAAHLVLTLLMILKRVFELSTLSPPGR